VLSRHNFRRTYHGALANPATAGLRPTAARVLGALRDHGPLTADQLAALLSTKGRTATMATVDHALVELAAAGAATVDAHTGRWTLRFSTWLEDAGIPARVIDELMGHQASGRAGRHQASAIGAHYRHTTPEMAARVVAAVEERLVVVLATAEAALDRQPW
jgi:integrase